MNEVNRTLYIPLYGKAWVSRKGVILRDPKAEAIWQAEQFPLRGKSASRWLAYFMAMRARVFDDWATSALAGQPEAVVLHIGCGMDSRCLRIGGGRRWYDVDLPEVILERRKYFAESKQYTMLAGNAATPAWVDGLQDAPQAIVLLEGISMYLQVQEIRALFEALSRKYASLRILMDVYTVFGAKASKYKNPINDVGVTQVWGMDDPACVLGQSGVEFVGEMEMAPRRLVEELRSFERWFFARMFAGGLARRMYRLFAYEKPV